MARLYYLADETMGEVPEGSPYFRWLQEAREWADQQPGGEDLKIRDDRAQAATQYWWARHNRIPFQNKYGIWLNTGRA